MVEEQLVQLFVVILQVAQAESQETHVDNAKLLNSPIVVQSDMHFFV